jgi:hypothetical protein
MFFKALGLSKNKPGLCDADIADMMSRHDVRLGQASHVAQVVPNDCIEWFLFHPLPLCHRHITAWLTGVWHAIVEEVGSQQQSDSVASSMLDVTNCDVQVIVGVLEMDCALAVTLHEPLLGGLLQLQKQWRRQRPKRKLRQRQQQQHHLHQRQLVGRLAWASMSWRQGNGIQPWMPL